MLYMRSFFIMIIGFWTGRLTLEALGIDNYGINNVVGSIVGFSGLISGALSAAGSRFITVAIGKGDMTELKGVFNSSFHVQLILSVVIFIFLEIGGIWFLNTEANIPNGRMFAANIVLQTSILSLLIGLLMVPYNSLIIAYERMSLYAYVNIIEILVNLAIVIYVLHTPFDKLITLATLQLCVASLTTFFYAIYSRKNFEAAHLSLNFDWNRIRSICSFSSWNLIGNATWIFNTQGLNMLINVFFGVVYNTTRGVAATVNGCVQTFVKNFSMAFTPQITKSYAAEDLEYCFLLINRSTRISCMLQILFSVPIFLEAETILKIWLVDVPPMACLFLRFTLIESFVLSLSGSYLKLLQANGKIKKVTLETSVVSFLVFPLTWIFFKLNFPVWTSYPIMIIVYMTILGFYLYESSVLTKYNWKSFFTSVACPTVVVILTSAIPSCAIPLFFNPSIVRFLIVVPISVLWTATCIYLWGLDSSEKTFVRDKIKSILQKTIPALSNRLPDNY